jgi:poly(hydroxyalkanoate) granule-associated protein
MSETKNENPGTGESKADAAAKQDWAEQLKKVAYAAIGAANVSPEDVKGFVKRLVEKGEIAKKDGEKILKDFADKVQKTVKRDAKSVVADAKEAVTDAAEKAQQQLNQEKLAERINTSIERMLHGMNIATRKDLADLGKQLDELDKKVTELVDAAGSVASRGGSRKQPAPQACGTGA